MANADKPCGFKFGYTLHGGPPAIHKYTNTAVAIYPGDHVYLSAGRVETVISTEGGMGVAMNYVSATSGQDVWVMDDLQNTIFIVQCDEDDVTATTQIGDFYDVLATTGNTTTLKSLQELNTDASGEDQLELIGLVDRPDNDWGEFCDVYVRFNVDTRLQTKTIT